MPGEGAKHPLNQQLSEHIEEVENMLGGGGAEGEEDEVVVAGNGTPRRLGGVTRLMEEAGSTSTPNITRNLFSQDRQTPLNSPGVGRAEARPSPERLDAQVGADFLRILEDLETSSMTSHSYTLKRFFSCFLQRRILG